MANAKRKRPNRPRVNSIPLLSDEEVARSAWVIRRSDGAGYIQSLTGTRKFTHAETGKSYPVATFDEPAERQAGIELFRVVQSDPPDSRWFENHQMAIVHQDDPPQVNVEWSADIKPFTEEMKVAAKARVWDHGNTLILPYDPHLSRPAYFNEPVRNDVAAYVNAIETEYNQAEAALDLAEDTAAVGRAEETFYDSTSAEALPPPDPNPHRNGQ